MFGFVRTFTRRFFFWPKAMLDNLVMLIGNAVYFKSKWKYPFDPLDTLSLPFKDDNGRILKNIPMMNMAAVLPLGYNAELESQIVEIPYAVSSFLHLTLAPFTSRSFCFFSMNFPKLSICSKIYFGWWNRSLINYFFSLNTSNYQNK